MEKKRDMNRSSGAALTSPAEITKEIDKNKQAVRKADTLPEVKTEAPGTKPHIPGKI